MGSKFRLTFVPQKCIQVFQKFFWSSTFVFFHFLFIYCHQLSKMIFNIFTWFHFVSWFNPNKLLNSLLEAAIQVTLQVEWTFQHLHFAHCRLQSAGCRCCKSAQRIDFPFEMFWWLDWNWHRWKPLRQVKFLVYWSQCLYLSEIFLMMMGSWKMAISMHCKSWPVKCAVTFVHILLGLMEYRKIRGLSTDGI